MCTLETLTYNTILAIIRTQMEGALEEMGFHQAVVAALHLHQVHSDAFVEHEWIYELKYREHSHHILNLCFIELAVYT